jgi:hypothetical protein
MRILADYHHHDLWESLELLFTDRFGWTLFRPIGMDWFTEGYWNHERSWHGDAVARQYLEPWGSDLGGKRLDKSHGRYHNLITLEQARDAGIDVVISTLAHNHEGFARFAQEIGATFGLHIGNVRFSELDMAEDRWDLASFGLVSGLMPTAPPKPHVVYRQEFSLTDFRSGPPPRKSQTVSSFVQCYPETAWAYERWQQVANLRSQSDWRVYGSYGTARPDRWQAGNLDRCADVGEAMRNSDVAWHAKRWSDGYGHVIHNWFAVGRPVLGYEAYYAPQMAGPLWVEGETSFDLERRTDFEVVELLDRLEKDEDFHLRVCENAARRFRDVVDFDAEAEQVRKLLEAVL